MELNLYQTKLIERRLIKEVDCFVNLRKCLEK